MPLWLLLALGIVSAALLLAAGLAVALVLVAGASPLVALGVLALTDALILAVAFAVLRRKRVRL
ncbi:MAG: hypothetical protein HYY00_07775 [Chloroflexi bacterium]|nr:hypothetical protein [Chloroflexota bacterium]